MTRFIRSIVALPLCLTCIALAVAQKPNDRPKVKVEFRWAEESPTAGLTENKGVDLSCSEKKAYLHIKPILTNPDIATARSRRGSGVFDDKFLIEVNLTREAAKKMAKSSAENLNKPLVILVDGKIVAAMVVKAKLSDFVPITG